MSRSHRKHTDPKERAIRAARARNAATTKLAEKSHKQRRPQERIQWRREA